MRGEFDSGENFTGGKLRRGCTDRKVNEQKVSSYIQSCMCGREGDGAGGGRVTYCEQDQHLRLDTGTCLQDVRR